LVPVALNSVLIVVLGLCFHKLSGRSSYPHVPAPVPVNTHKTLDVPPQQRVGFRPEDVDAALDALGETFDIDRNDLDVLLRKVETEALVRSHATLLCGDIMSRDVISVDQHADPAEARSLLLAHNIRTLPVTDETGRLIGTVGLREVMLPAGEVGEVMSKPATASVSDPAARLVPTLTDGRTHAVVVIDDNRKIAGLITQTDLLAALVH
jgi:CBS domain-containing membrane protein